MGENLIVEPPRAEARGSSTCFVGPAFAEAASRRRAEPSEAYPTTLVGASRGTLHAFIHGLKDRGFLRRRVNRRIVGHGQ